jgi:hypothetical protein
VTDGLKTSIDVVRKAFRSRQPGTGGRARLIGWPDVVITQVIKQYAERAVTGTLERLVHGSVRMFLTLLWSTKGCQVLNTAFIERPKGMRHVPRDIHKRPWAADRRFPASSQAESITQNISLIAVLMIAQFQQARVHWLYAYEHT